jgi:lysyl-tRNA synthetase class 2
MLELYQAYGDYHSMMDLTEGMIVAAIDAIDGKRQRAYGERTLDFGPPWPRQKYADLFREHVGLPIDADDTLLTETARERGIEVVGRHRDVIVHTLFEHSVEAALAKSDRPVFVFDYPATLCPLTKRKHGQPDIAERFELYVAGMELANAYTELNDPVMQEATFRQQLAGLPPDESMAKMDEDFVRALRHGMPPAGGLGVGIDRLVMLLTDTTTIRDVILFPLLRPEAK